MRYSLQILFRRLARPLRFGAVGISGIVVNSAILWLLVRELHVSVTLASVIATQAAILSNFALNDSWTFRGARERSLGGRLLRFNGVALGGMAITAGILTALTSYTHLLLANLLAVGAATAWNYIVNSRWTWSRGTARVGDGAKERRGDGISPARSLVGDPSPVVAEEVAA